MNENSSVGCIENFLVIVTIWFEIEYFEAIGMGKDQNTNQNYFNILFYSKLVFLYGNEGV